MPKITDPAILALAEPGETPYEAMDDDYVLMQRECFDCDHGLLLAPARFCRRCSGSGYLVRQVRRPA